MTARWRRKRKYWGGDRSAGGALPGSAVRPARGKQVSRNHVAEWTQGNALSERSAERRDHRVDRGARERHGDQALDREPVAASANPAVDIRMTGISENDLQLSFVAEFTENDIFPPTDITEDWFKLIDFDPENVVKISPVRPRSSARPGPAG